MLTIVPALLLPADRTSEWLSSLVSSLAGGEVMGCSGLAGVSPPWRGSCSLPGRGEIKSGSGWSIEVGPGQEQICIWSTDGGVRRRRSLWGGRRRRRRWGSSFAKSWRPLAYSPFWLRQVRKEYFVHCQFSLDISLNSWLIDRWFKEKSQLEIYFWENYM